MNLRRKRHDLQMTQEELAERAGLSARYVGAIERGDVSASVTGASGTIAGSIGNRSRETCSGALGGGPNRRHGHVLCSSTSTALGCISF